MTVAFVFTNPRHHLEMMAPVAAELERRGVRTELVSLAEFRGFDTPRDARLRRAIPVNLRRGERARVEPASPRAHKITRGRVAQLAVWQLVRVRLWQMLRGARVVVIPNDLVYPYAELLRDLHRRRVKTVLLQEGIRFPLPSDSRERFYGGGGTAAICAWGEGSRDYFLARGAPERTIIVTGAPRMDDLDLERWRVEGRQLLAAKGFTTPPIAFLSNPIEIAGHGTKAAKLELFGRFLAESAAVLRARNIPIAIKTHMHENPGEFLRVAESVGMGDLVSVLDAPIFAVLAAVRAGVVLSSTVGLEALLFDTPIAQLEIPGQGFVFEYVERGAATPLPLGAIGAGMEQLIAGSADRREAGRRFVERHLHDRGNARLNVATVIERVLSDRIC